MRLFAERGFDAVTIEEIAAEVGMSPRTFFRYFVSKDEVVLRLRRRLLARLLTVFQANAQDAPPITALRDAYVATSVVPPEEHDEFVRVGRFLVDSPTLLVRSRGDWVADTDDLVIALAERLGVDVEEDPIAETIVAAMNGAASAAFHRWICTGGQGNHSEAVAAALDHLIEGLGGFDIPPKSRRRSK
jgi:AcrR family transcriptional regulator